LPFAFLLLPYCLAQAKFPVKLFKHTTFLACCRYDNSERAGSHQNLYKISIDFFIFFCPIRNDYPVQPITFSERKNYGGEEAPRKSKEENQWAIQL
jgi:hypothetical protein